MCVRNTIMDFIHIRNVLSIFLNIGCRVVDTVPKVFLGPIDILEEIDIYVLYCVVYVIMSQIL